METEYSVKKHVLAFEEYFAEGNFRKAKEDLKKFPQPANYSKLPLTDPWRALATSIAARLYFYRGENDRADSELNEYVKNADLFLSIPGLPVGQKLVLAEHAYSQRLFDKAANIIISKILKECEENNDLSGQGESCHFLARCYSKLHQYDDVRRQCNRARECFLQHYLNNSLTDKINDLKIFKSNTQMLRWRIGLTYLVEGFSLWRKGDTLIANHKLRTAESLLNGTGDYIDEANVLQGLGCIRRTQGNNTEALALFENALGKYREGEHRLNQSRTLLNIGRTYLRMGDKYRDRASSSLNEALKISESINQPRQKAEVLVNMSWLYLDLRDEDKAEAHALSALKIALSPAGISLELQAEARISLGNCHLKNGNHEKAIGDLKIALRDAQTPKLKINAHLTLASAFLGIHNFTETQQHLSEANKMLDSGISSRYLDDKLHSVIEQFDALKEGYYLIEFANIGKQVESKSYPKDLREAIKSLEKWAISKALEQSNNNIEQAAKKLGLNSQALWQRKKRAGL